MDNKINKILFITLSNIGDCILTLPVLDFLLENFPGPKITVMSGPRPRELFENNPYLDQTIIFDKRWKLREKIKLIQGLRKQKFDLIIDLRNSILGPLISLKYLSPVFNAVPKNKVHMKDRHLYQIPMRVWNAQTPFQTRIGISGKSLYMSEKDKRYIDDMLRENNISGEDKIIVIAAGARSHIKKWPQDRFAGLISSLPKEGPVKIVLIGDKDDIATNKYIAEHTQIPLLDLSGKTALMQLAALLKRASLLITNDSAPLHLGSYLNLPIVAIFGPTNELKYGPWSEVCAVVKKDIHCRPCEKAQCRFGALKCMEIIQIEDVLRQVRNILDHRPKTIDQRSREEFKRILVVRTDRIGDVLLSTPVIKALRDNYPDAFIAMMVSPSAKDIIEGNPYLDEAIVFDKDAKHKGWWRSFKFSRYLKKKKFDLALILHPTNRVHLVTFHAGIPRRIGYNRKCGFLLTDKIGHTKQFGEKHELEYNLDLIRCLELEPHDKHLFMPIRPESEKWAEELLEEEGIKKTDKLLAIHPGASCPSKIWPNERFAEVADKLIEKYGFKVLVIAGPRDTALADNVIKHMRYQAVNLAGKTSIAQMASVLKRCRIFISNDSGPVHIGSAVGVPVISIFGRAQKGLSPRRWGPLGKKDRILHKSVGCLECLAHNCVKGFACLKAITVEDVLNSASLIMEEA